MPFNVKVNKTEVVAAVLPMQQHWLPLSNLDLLLPPIDTGVLFCYQYISDEATKLLENLKTSLAETLVSYYVFAGEIVHNLAGEPEVLCNNSGVHFTKAFADVELKQINFYDADQSIEGKLVPKKTRGVVLAVQVTELSCGGIVVGCTFDHRVADAYSANMFLVSWSELALSKPLSQLPSFRRSFLFPRRPGYYHDSMNDLYVPISTLPPTKPDTLNPNDQVMMSRIYYVTVDKIAQIQSLANSTDHQKSTTNLQRSKLESFSAFLWKTIASGIKENSNFRIGIVADGRTRLSNGDCMLYDNLLKGYFGNVLSIPFGMKTVEELKEKPLSWVAKEVQKIIKRATTREHFLGLIDWVEAHRPEPAVAKIYSRYEDGPAVVVSSGQRFPARKVDFGFGKPVFWSYHFPWASKTGYVMPMPSPKGNGDWIVYMHLMKWQLELIEDSASNVFKPITAEYLNLV